MPCLWRFRQGCHIESEKTCTAAASTEGQSHASKFQAPSGNVSMDLDDEGAAFPRSSDGGTSMDVDSSYADDPSINDSANPDEACTGESNKAPAEDEPDVDQAAPR